MGNSYSQEDEIILIEQNPNHNFPVVEIVDDELAKSDVNLNSTGNSSQSSRAIIKLDRANFAIKLRVMGYNYDDISSAVRAKYGNLVSEKYSAQSARADVKYAMENVRKNLSENTEDLIMRSTLLLDQLESSIIPKALAGDLKAIDRVLSIEERRSKLHGLDKPSKVEVHDWRSELLSLLQQGRITIQQVQNELGDGYARELSDKLIVAGGANFLESGDVEEGSYTESSEQVA